MRKIETMEHVDMSDLKMPMIAVYKSPEDFPGQCVARIYDMDKPTDVIMIKNTVGEIELDVRKHTTMVFMPRGKEDVAALVGVWM